MELLLLLPLFACVLRAEASPLCFSALFSFGDSKADTGNLQAAFPFESRSESSPYGRTFFGAPSDRFCDGRLVIDFQAEAYGFPFLSPYLRGLGSHFCNGVNFAYSGSGALHNFTSAPFNLNRQFRHFRKFKLSYMKLAGGRCSMEASDYFSKGLYVVSTGENDYREGLKAGFTVDLVKRELVPRVVAATKDVLKGLYEEGGRLFFVVGIAADGCIPLLSAIYPSTPKDYDCLGCLMPVNDYVKLHNTNLYKAVKDLRKQYPDARFAFGDYYGINIEILSFPQKYGLQDIHKACCGIGGAYNYNRVVQCGETGEIDGRNVTAVSCADPSLYVNWDGIHLTESFYREVARAFLEGRFVDQPIPLPQGCQVSFQHFESITKEGFRTY